MICRIELWSDPVGPHLETRASNRGIPVPVKLESGSENNTRQPRISWFPELADLGTYCRDPQSVRLKPDLRNPDIIA
jgi:hypothetical protein